MIEVKDKVLVYSNTTAGVTVYKARLEAMEVAVKEQVTNSLPRANEAINESLNQAQLDHPNVCRVYKCYLDSEMRQGFKTVIVMEWMERDVYSILRERQVKKEVWREEELWSYATQLIEALGYAQAKGIAHRDIKPQNIFLNAAGDIKIGDFGASKWQLLDVNQQTIQGTPFFLSPALREHYHTYILTGQNHVLHNQYKSDVYSLGLTFLFMALLNEPKELLTLAGLQENTNRLISSILYSDRFKNLLYAMLTVNEENRPDFIELVRSLSLQKRSGLSLFREEMKAEDVSMKSSMQLESLSHCLLCASSKCTCVVLDCLQCSRRFQSGGELWRMKLSEEGQVDLTSICSEECAWKFLQMLNIETCVFCSSNISSKVNLPCGHFFCAPHCFHLYLMRCTCADTLPTVVRCPTCSSPVPNSLKYDVFGNEFGILTRNYKENVCVECCETGEIAAPMTCGEHFVCRNCEEGVTFCPYCIS